jgi:hypothetical protein
MTEKATTPERARKVTTAEEAARFFNEKRIYNRTDWRISLDGKGDLWLLPSSWDEVAILDVDAIAIANALSGYTESLEAEIERLAEQCNQLRLSAKAVNCELSPLLNDLAKGIGNDSIPYRYSGRVQRLESLRGRLRASINAIESANKEAESK